MSRDLPKPPPGRACFPHWLKPMGTKISVKNERLAKKLARRNLKHAVRWLEVYRLRELSLEAFKQETGLKKTWDNTFLAAAKKMHVDSETIRSSYKMVQQALKVGDGGQYFGTDWPPIPKKQGKKIV